MVPVDYTLPDSAAPLREAARRLVDEVLRPHLGQLPAAEGPWPDGLRAQAREARAALGLWGLSVPTSEGGRGLRWIEIAVVQEEVGASPVGLWAHGLLAQGEPPRTLVGARGDIRRRYLLPCLRGNRQAYQVFGGPGIRVAAGTGVLDGVLHDVPAFVAEDIVLLVVGPDAYLLDPGTPGYRRTPRRPTMGAAELVDLVMEGCHALGVLPGAAPVAETWRAGVRAAVLGARAVGAAQWCLEQALRYANARKTFGKPLADRQAIQWMIADSARELHAARLLVYRACAALDSGEDAREAAAAAKVYATDAACRIADRTLQIHGGSGYTRDLPFERIWRELRFYRLWEGPNDRLAAEGAGARVVALQR